MQDVIEMWCSQALSDLAQIVGAVICPGYVCILLYVILIWCSQALLNLPQLAGEYICTGYVRILNCTICNSDVVYLGSVGFGSISGGYICTGYVCIL